MEEVKKEPISVESLANKTYFHDLWEKTAFMMGVTEMLRVVKSFLDKDDTEGLKEMIDNFKAGISKKQIVRDFLGQYSLNERGDEAEEELFSILTGLSADQLEKIMRDYYIVLKDKVDKFF